MYQVLIHNGGVTIDATADRGLIAGSIVEGVNEFASFSFTLLPSSAAYNSINPLSTLVEVLDGSTVKFSGRVLTETPSMSQTGLVQKDVICEDRMAYLCDSIQPYTPEHQYEGDPSRTGLQEFIDVVLANHNAQVESYKQISRGTVSVTPWAGSTGVYKGLNYENTWQTLKTKLIDVFGGEMRVRESGGDLYLDYEDNLGSTRATTIEVTKNMIAANRTIDPANVVSRLIPLGAKLTVEVTDADGNTKEQETEERLTVDSVNGGLNYVENATAKALYGIQYKAMVWDDVHDPLILLQRGQYYMSTQNKALATHSVSALDLSFIGEAVDEFKLYDKFPVNNSVLGISDTLEVIKKTTDIFTPFNPTLTFGDKSINLNDIISGNIGKAQNNAELLSTAETAITNGINNVYTYVQETATSLQQNTDSLIATVEQNTVAQSDFDEFSELVRNILQMDAAGTTMIFQNILTEISTVNDAQNTNYQEILKYIRFENGSIVIGIVGNEIQLQLQNDRLSFLQNGAEVAYMSNDNLYIYDATFLNSLRLGKFAFIPRTNGNLSFQKVGD